MQRLGFEILHTDGAARRGRLTTRHGTIETPVFMPVGTLASVKSLTTEQLKALGPEIILNNTYHLMLRPGVDLIERLGGAHRFQSWDRAILTDSGGFQVFSLSSIRKLREEGVEFRSHIDGSLHFLSPETSIEIQQRMGVDIAMAFDECPPHGISHAEAKKSMELTHRWARRSLLANARPSPGASRQPLLEGEGDADKQHSSLSLGRGWRVAPGEGLALFGIAQGGIYKDLRKRSVEEIASLDFDGIAIGGVAVGESKAEMREIIDYTTPLLPADKPRYLMGVGTPEDLLDGVAAGIDMFDCVMPTRNARNGSLFTSLGKVAIKNARFAADPRPLDPNCSCTTCTTVSRAYLRHLYVTDEIAAHVYNTIHNVSFYLDLMRSIRQAIASNSLGSFRDSFLSRMSSGDAAA
ncbi:MAG TPA: tRNA guanosine(34) transglycosylase Tgt [Thermoanaerobaculia bacterium]